MAYHSAIYGAEAMLTPELSFSCDLWYVVGQAGSTIPRPYPTSPIDTGGGSAMTFDELLAQVLDLLQRQGRVSYGALKRRFGLDDDYLDDLKTELIEAQRLAVDEQGRILVWSGDPAVTPVPTSAPARAPDRA